MTHPDIQAAAARRTSIKELRNALRTAKYALLEAYESGYDEPEVIEALREIRRVLKRKAVKRGK